MLAVRGIYDGEKIIPTEKISLKTKQEVIITFLGSETEQDQVRNGGKPESAKEELTALELVLKADKTERAELIKKMAQSGAEMYKNEPLEIMK